jgi:hypothetical protein
MATVTEILALARSLARAEARTDEIRRQRDAAIVAAHRRGESPRVLAEAAGISQQRLFAILHAAREGE